MNPSPPYDLSIDLDRADQEVDLCLIQSTTGQRCSAVVDIDSGFSRRMGGQLADGLGDVGFGLSPSSNSLTPHKRHSICH